MPELPEVETIKTQLNKLRGEKISRVEIRLAKMLQNVSAVFFKKKVQGTRIKEIRRRAKLLIIDLDNNYSLVIHLKISGQLIFFKDCEFLNKEQKSYTHLIYYFSDNSCLMHNDLRRFGYVKLLKTDDLKKLFIQENYGPEPLDKDFTLEKFIELLSKKSFKKIKPLLMDQTFIAGVGNIYAQEACWWAKILPDRLVKTLSKEEIKNLYNSLIEILRAAIKDRGTTAADDNYIDAQGDKGKYAFKLKVYQRDSQKCFRCQKTIKRIVMAGRGTSYCPGCQK